MYVILFTYMDIPRRSLIDNFEWAFGFSHRFGLVYVDFTDTVERPRTPKVSFEFQCINIDGDVHKRRWYRSRAHMDGFLKNADTANTVQMAFAR